MENLQDVLAAIAAAAGQRSWGRGTWFERETEALGHKVAHTTTNAILNGTYRHKPTADTLASYSRVADRYGIDGVRVFDAAGQPQRAGEFAQQLPDDVDDLDPRSRAFVLEMIRYLLEVEHGRRERIDEWLATQGLDTSNVVDINSARLEDIPRLDPGPGESHPALPSVTRWHDDLGIPATGGDEPGTHGDGHEFDV